MLFIYIIKVVCLLFIFWDSMRKKVTFSRGNFDRANFVCECDEIEITVEYNISLDILVCYHML